MIPQSHSSDFTDFLLQSLRRAAENSQHQYEHIRDQRRHQEDVESIRYFEALIEEGFIEQQVAQGHCASRSVLVSQSFVKERNEELFQSEKDSHDSLLESEGVSLPLPTIPPREQTQLSDARQFEHSQEDEKVRHKKDGSQRRKKKEKKHHTSLENS
ncbi:MAG: hypothetical protein C5B47_05620, partial [Verrucomicrobia bacterium]